MSEVTVRRTAVNIQGLKIKYIDRLVPGLMLVAGLAAAWLPAGWTRYLKRVQQPLPYFGLAAGYILVYALACWWVLRQPDQTYRRRWGVLLALVIIPNLVNIWVRYGSELGPGQPLFGRDGDIGLYYEYGHKFALGQPPTHNGLPVEYPPGALLLFWAGERLAGGELNNFYWVFPAWMLVWQVAAAAALYGIGLKVKRAPAGFLLAAFAAGSPFLMQFYYTRFDIAPAALLLGSVYFFLPGPGQEGYRMVRCAGAGWSGLSAGAGFVVKWLPSVAVPALVAAYLQTRRWRDAAMLSATAIFAALVVMLPFWLADPTAFWYPYRWQNGRQLIGESFWFLVQYHLFDPSQNVPARPWSEPDRVVLTNGILQAAQVGLVAVVFGVAAWRLLGRGWATEPATVLYDRWAAVGLVAFTVFTLANRIFSPQFVVLAIWALAAAFILRPVSWRSGALLCGGLTGASYASFLVFHLGAFEEQWLRFSLIFFGLIWLITIWIWIRSLSHRRAGN